MKRKLSVLLAVSALILVVTAPGAYCQMLNPYAPTNAVAAHPPTPYNLWQIPCISRTSYLPCLTCGPVGTELPDSPPLWQRFPGPFGILVPVP